uniref:ARMET C-terminal domain-containing protein n=1 Tax=Tetradesmus obliquus TaxID=3088 RepID=A0A383VW28_TETOB|eukprot:jgi/Sobl393_1/7158/SZX69685.1
MQLSGKQCLARQTRLKAHRNGFAKPACGLTPAIRDTIHPRAHAAFNAFSDNGTFNPHLGASKRRAVAAAAQAGAGATCAPRFAQQQGPQPVTTLPVLKVPLGASPNDPSMPLELQLEVLTPQSGSACPVVIFTPGFLLNSSLYRSYAQRLASWGYTVLLWDLSDVLDDTLTVAYMKQVIDMCGSDPRLRQYCNCSKLLLMGHSRGAKLSCLIADQEPRVQGLCLIDPVDNSSFGPQGVGYPSSLPSLQAAASSRQLPVLIIGAALNTDVVPPEANWRRFVAAAAAGRAPVWEVVLRGSSHLQFLDKQQPLFALFSNNGPTPDEVVRQITQTCMVAFAQLALCPSTPYNSAQVQTLLAEESEALKRLAPLDCSFQNMNQLRTAAPPPSPGAAAASNGGSSSSSTRACYSSAAGSSSSSSRPGPKPVQASYGQLMGMRVRELKRLLQEHGVDSADCFEKEELVKRVLERCTLSA